MGAVEALGAVAHSGNRSGHDLAADRLAYVADVPRHNDKEVVVTNPDGDYTVRDCLNRRDFSAHGGALLASGVLLDPRLTVGLLCLTVTALDRWWSSLKVELDVKRCLALANVVPLVTDGRVVFVEDLWQALADRAMPGGEVRHQSWRSFCL